MWLDPDEEGWPRKAVSGATATDAELGGAGRGAAADAVTSFADDWYGWKRCFGDERHDVLCRRSQMTRLFVRPAVERLFGLDAITALDAGAEGLLAVIAPPRCDETLSFGVGASSVSVSSSSLSLFCSRPRRAEEVEAAAAAAAAPAAEEPLNSWRCCWLPKGYDEDKDGSECMRGGVGSGDDVAAMLLSSVARELVRGAKAKASSRCWWWCGRDARTVAAISATSSGRAGQGGVGVNRTREEESKTTTTMY